MAKYKSLPEVHVAGKEAVTPDWTGAVLAAPLASCRPMKVFAPKPLRCYRFYLRHVGNPGRPWAPLTWSEVELKVPVPQGKQRTAQATRGTSDIDTRLEKRRIDTHRNALRFERARIRKLPPPDPVHDPEEYHFPGSNRPPIPSK